MTQTHSGKIERVDFRTELGDRYLSYAMSTIVSRSLPDVRDGLKPVTRRILYTMAQMKIYPNTPTKKSARIVGPVQGLYHPHGEKAVYDALVRMAQDFVMRYPLVIGQGNFGSIDGDEAAASRYTEAKLAPAAMSLLDGIQEDAVTFRPNYDGSEQEPTVLPAAFPNLLVNGALGIAVGMATSILPHNLEEVCQALTHLIDHPEMDVDQLLTFVPGPDFPTGGTLVDSQPVIRQAYATGRGSFRVRSKYHVEPLKGGGYTIIVTEIPYLVQKSKLIEKTADLLLAKKLPLLADIQDESAQDIRIVLTPKNRQVDPDVLMSTLFKNTDFESRLSLNMNVLTAEGAPKVLPFIEVMKAFLASRYEVLKRRSHFKIEKISNRLEILEGFLIVFVNIDEVIRIIRHEDNPKEKIRARWGLSEAQTEAILNLKLRTLQKLEELAIRTEHEALQAEKAGLEALLASQDKMDKKIKEELQEMRALFAKQTHLKERRTLLKEAAEVADIPTEAFIPKESVTLICSETGWIRTMKGSVDPSEVKYKEGDQEFIVKSCQTTDYALIFASNGRFYTQLVHDLPKGRGFGEPLSVLLDLEKGVSVVNILLLSSGEEETQVLVAAKDGRGFLVNKKDVFAQTKNGKQILNVTEPNQAHLCKEVSGDHIAIVGDNRRLIIYKTDDLPVMNRGRGVMLQKYRGGGLSDVTFFAEEEGLSWVNGKRTFSFEPWREWIGKRGLAGRFVPTGFPRSNTF